MEELVTDAAFKQLHLVNFWVTEEPERFETKKGGRESDMNIMEMLELTYVDGSTECIYSDDAWLCKAFPLVENDIQYGERYDTRLETADWCAADVDISGFVPVASRENTDHRELLEQNYPLIQKIKEYPLTEYRELQDGSFLYDGGKLAWSARYR